MSDSDKTTEHIDREFPGDETNRIDPAQGTPSSLGDLIGTTLDDRYVIEQKLGQGGFGAIYLAADNKVVSRKVVVKIMRPEETRNEWSKRKFHQEVEALARIDHPSIVGILDCGETAEGLPYLVMQFIDGVSLRSIMTVEGMEFYRVANIIKQTGKALSAAHQVGILHRDLKPENIMVQSREGEDLVKIIDFGIAKVKDSVISGTTAKDVAVGTIAYMSPEQLSALPLTPESDIYALGVIAYEMLTGKRPTNPDSAFQLLEFQRSGVRVRPSDLRPSLPLEAEDILLKALSFEVGDRFKKARDFGDSLAHALLNDDETKRQPGAAKRPKAQENTTLETAHVLFIDIVGYSKLLIDQQSTQLQALQQIVLATDECQRANAAGSVIRLPTGDGMALVFLDDPEAPVRCAVEISRKLRSENPIQLRMGIHSGLVRRVADINTNLNVAGGGINLAQRVMDCGDADHILVSRRVADDLGQLARWSRYLTDLGETEVKHGVRVHVFNLHGDDFGNPTPPVKFRKRTLLPQNRTKQIVWGGAALVLLLTMVLAAWYALSKKKTDDHRTVSSTGVPALPERVLTYWLKVQKMNHDQPDGEPIQSAGDLMYFNGWRFQFCVQPAEAGALYLVGFGPNKKKLDKYNILFPLPGFGKDDPNLSAGEIIQSDWARFVDEAGEEKIWVIWSTKELGDLNEVFKQAATNKQNPGVVEGPGNLEVIRKYVALSESSPAQVTPDRAKRITTVKGRGEIVVSLVKLDHE